MLDPAFFAATLGLPFDLVKGFFDISLILRSGLPIDPALLWALCAEVKRLYFETAPWAYMSPTLHKVLDHFPALLEKLPPTLVAAFIQSYSVEERIKRRKKKDIPPEVESSHL